jgi:serine/threonine protein kinase
MAQLVLSYSRESKDFVSKLALSLEARGVDVWYDHNLLPGDDYSKVIEEHIITSPAVLVVWSGSACKSKWVYAEATRANDYDKLLQAVCEQCELPLPFNSINYVDLTSWTGNPESQEISKIISAIQTQIQRKKIDQPVQEVEARAAQDFPEIARILNDEARVKVIKLVAQGDSSEVYLGRDGTRMVAVKALRRDELIPADVKVLSKEIELASYLQHPTFLRINEAIFREDRSFIVTDFFEGDTLLRKIKNGTKFMIGDVIGILHQLSTAVAEAHARGLQFLRITPSDILVRTSKVFDQEVARIAPINHTYFIECRRMAEEVRWHDDAGPYTAPELWTGDGSDSSKDDEISLREMHQKANQFALGMVAWTMLEGRVPVAIAQHSNAYAKVGAFLNASKGFSEQILKATWRTQARALAGIVSRMVGADPNRRWKDMKHVDFLIGALAADHATHEFRHIVKEAYNRICQGQPVFYQRFYDNFFRRAPHLRAKFSPDLMHQYQMLHFAAGQLLNFSQRQSEPTTLSHFVAMYAQFGLTVDDFVQFGEALVDTFASELADDPESHRTMAAFEIIIWPAIDYLIQNCVALSSQRIEATGSPAAESVPVDAKPLAGESQSTGDRP